MLAPDLRPGKRKCLKCDQIFQSIDLTTNRICPSCNKENWGEYTPRQASSRVYTKDGAEIHIFDTDD